MVWTLCTSGASIAKAGANANSSIVQSGIVLAKWSNEAEGRICAQTRRDWTGQYSTLSTNIQNVLSDTCSSMIAKQIIAYDLNSYVSRVEVLTMLNLHDDIIKTGLQFLEDFKSNKIQNP